jgi:hypothetical protein
VKHRSSFANGRIGRSRSDRGGLRGEGVVDSTQPEASIRDGHPDERVGAVELRSSFQKTKSFRGLVVAQQEEPAAIKIVRGLHHEKDQS